MANTSDSGSEDWGFESLKSNKQQVTKGSLRNGNSLLVSVFSQMGQMGTQDKEIRGREREDTDNLYH